MGANYGQKNENTNIFERKRPHQVSLLILHPWRADKVVLLPPPVPEAAEEVVGEEAADGVPDDVDVDGLLDPEPFRAKDQSCCCRRRGPPAPRRPRPLTW